MRLSTHLNALPSVFSHKNTRTNVYRRRIFLQTIQMNDTRQLPRNLYNERTRYFLQASSFRAVGRAMRLQVGHASRRQGIYNLKPGPATIVRQVSGVRTIQIKALTRIHTFYFRDQTSIPMDLHRLIMKRDFRLLYYLRSGLLRRHLRAIPTTTRAIIRRAFRRAARCRHPIMRTVYYQNLRRHYRFNSTTKLTRCHRTTKVTTGHYGVIPRPLRYRSSVVPAHVTKIYMLLPGVKRVRMTRSIRPIIR